jgi:hypothetical protein
MTDITRLMEDPATFGPYFEGDSWRPWKVVLKAVFGLPMHPDEQPLYAQLTGGRSASPTQQSKSVTLIMGRRSGKSRISALIAVYLALWRTWPNLTPHEPAVIMLMATTKRQATVILSYIRALLGATPELRQQVVSSAGDTITLANGITIECRALSFRSSRGVTILAFIGDECAFWRSDDSAVPDVEVIRSIRPAMLTAPGSMLVMISSPYAKRGYLWQQFRDNWGADDRPLVFRAASLVMNSTLDPADIDAERADDPASASSEYDAEFRNDIAAFLDAEVIEKLARTSPLELPRPAGAVCQAFVDPSGGSNDEMSIAIGWNDGGRIIIGCLRSIAAPFDPGSAVAQCVAAMAEYGVREVVGDAYGAAWVRAAFEQQQITYATSELPKSGIYLEAVAPFNQGRIELPPDRVLLSQLAQLERRTARSGKDSVDHPPAGHDDRANAVCGVAWLLDRADSASATVARVTEAFGQSLGRQLHDRDAVSNWGPADGTSTIGQPLPNSIGIKVVERDPEFGRWQ